MTAKKYHKKKSCIALGMIILLQGGPFFILTSYASELDPQVLVEQTTTEVQQKTTDTPDLDKVIPETIITAEISTTTSTLITTVEIPHVESTGTSTASSSTVFSDTPQSFETSSTSYEELNASSSGVSIGSSTEVTEATNLHENNGDLPIGTTTISTGSSVALANILNITNTNLINSTGSIILENFFNPQYKDVDTRLLEGTTSGLCTFLSCNGVDSITTKITAESTVDTDVSLIATSGSNEVKTVETAVIDTGNVYAGLNLVNIANTTLIDSHYLLLSLNSFGNFNGDIIFPSLSTFFSSPHESGSVSDFGSITTQTNTTLTNNLTVEANTGDNTVASSSGFIQTGSTDSSLNLYNNTDTILLGGNSLLLLLKVTGTWLGNLIGIKTPPHFIDDTSTHVLQIEDTVSRGVNNATTNISSSTALLTNNVKVVADSGKNITADTNTSHIITGDAYASVNIINIANTHIIGHNWILAIITIFGDFTGNIAFGRPDLWVGEQVSANATVENDTELLYKITITNKGDSNSSNVLITSSYDIDHLDIVRSDTPYSENIKGNLVFMMGAISPKESKEITFYAKVKESTPGTVIKNTVMVKGDEKDNNKEDNVDSTSITVTEKNTASGNGYSYILPENTILIVPRKIIPLRVQQKQQADTVHSILVTRISTSTVVTTEDSVVEQVIIIKNPTGTEIPSVVFNDYLIDDQGKKVKKETWDIGSLLPYEEVTLTYSLSFSEQTNKGVYILSSEVLGNQSQNIFFANNGVVTYLPLKKSPKSTVVPKVSRTSFVDPPIKSISHIKKVVLKPQHENSFIETAYAADEATGSSPIPFQDTSSSFQYVILFGAFSTLRLFSKRPRLRLLK